MKYPYYDLAWIATDSRGAVASFDTGGEGPIPLLVMQLELQELRSIREKLLGIPVSGKSRVIYTYPYMKPFVDLAERGCFVYDWADVHRPSRSCEMICEPTFPLMVDNLPCDLKGVALGVTLSGVVFEQNRMLDIRQFIGCFERPPN